MNFPNDREGPFYVRSDFLTSPDGCNKILFGSQEEYLRPKLIRLIDPRQYRHSADHFEILSVHRLDPLLQTRSAITDNFFPATVRFQGQKVGIGVSPIFYKLIKVHY
jgi:hypothetical protein